VSETTNPRQIQKALTELLVENRLERNAVASIRVYGTSISFYDHDGADLGTLFAHADEGAAVELSWEAP
jgi:hypothetical protein